MDAAVAPRSDCDSSTAPAPSPKKTQVRRSLQFMIFEKASVPITSAWRYRSGAVSIMLCATLSAKTKPAQTEFTSKAGHWPIGDAQLLLDHAGDGRLRLIGRGAGDDDQVDGRLVDAGVGQAAPGRLGPHVAGRLVLARRPAAR